MAYEIHMGCQMSIICRNRLWLDHTITLTPCQPSTRSSAMGLTRINNLGRGKRRGKTKKKNKEQNGLLFANKQTIKMWLNFSFLCSSDGSLFQMERGTVKRKTFLILFPNWHDEHPELRLLLVLFCLVFKDE